MDSRRGLLLYATSFGVAWITIAMLAGPGPAAWVRITERLSDAGLYFAVFSLAAAAGAALGGRLMDRAGRRRVLVGAHLLAALGYLLAGVGYRDQWFPLFAFGVVLVAAGFGTIGLTRVAAIDLVPQERGRAVAVVQTSALAGALVGPLLLVASEPIGGAIGHDPRALVWFLAPPLLVVSAAFAFRAPEVAGRAPEAPAATPVSAPGIPRAPLAAAVAAIGLAEAAMVAVMGTTGAALTHAGHGVDAIGAVMASHFLGMFALSLVVGRIADRLGRRATILMGFGTMAAGGLVVALLHGVPAFALGLFLVGLGWSFAYIGGTVLLTDVTPEARRARVVGLTDLVGRLATATAAAAGGWWYATRGIEGLGFAAAGILLIPTGLALAVRERKPGRYDAAGS